MRRTICMLSIMLFAICSLQLWGQNVSSALQGTVVDSTNAVVVGASVQVVNQGTGLERTVDTNSKGTFRYSQLPPGVYQINVKASGFKSYSQKDITLVGSETRDLGNMKLDIGNATEQVEVSAEVTPVQVASSEKSTSIDPKEMQNQTVRGRDMVAFMDMIPGLVDTDSQAKAGGNADRNVSSTEALAGVTLNGADAWHINFTVDGVPVMDNTNQKMHYEPNVDSIQEMKVMSSSYQAEFGRNSGGTITIVTKGGSNQFHGSGWYAHKHEQFNANTWANKDFASESDFTARTRNRSNVAGWTLGGPLYIPGKFNTQKNKIFFFASQEYTRQLVPSSSSTNDATFPTDAQADGNFSATVDSSGTPVALYYNNNGTRTLIPGCETTRSTDGGTCNLSGYGASTQGKSLLKWFNSYYGANAKTFPSANQYLYNWESPAVSGSHPRRNDMIRVDANVTSNLSAYFRWIQDIDSQVKHSMQGTMDVYPTVNNNPGHGYVGNATWTINPSTVNELSVGYDFSEDDWNLASSSGDVTSSILGVTMPFTTTVSNVTPDILSDIFFTSSIDNGPTRGGGSCTATPCNSAKWRPFKWGINENQHYWTISDNLSKTIKSHNLKAGIYIEIENKIKPGTQYYNGEFAFGSDQAGNVLDTGDGYANAYLGHFTAFQQASQRTVSHIDYTNFEWYVQDNWRVNSRFTLDAGVRFHHYTPFHDDNKSTAVFMTSKFDFSAIPDFNTDGTLACNGTGTNCNIKSGYYDNGMVVAGANGNSVNTYSTRWLAVAPRLGFALDVFGNGKTAVRGGFGLFFNRESGQLYDAGGNMNMAGQAPVLQNAALGWGTFTALSSMTSPVSAVSLTNWVGKTPLSNALNASFSVQQNLGHSFVMELSYIGAWAQNQPGTNSYNINPVPLWSCYNCSTSGTTSSTNYNMLRPYLGYKDIYMQDFDLYNNYHSLQGTLQRRFSNGLMVGVAYTLSKQLSLAKVDTLLTAQQNKALNYGGGPASTNLMINYNYDLPKLSKKLGDQAAAKYVGIITDNWTVSGITHFSTGTSYNVGCSTTATGYDGTGTGSSGDESTACDLVSNPKSNRGKLQFNPDAFTMAATHTLGNAGQYYLVGPGISNWDLTLRRNIPLGGEGRRKIVLEAAAYNLFNHAQFTTVNYSITFACENGSIENNNSCSGSWSNSASTISTTGKPGTGVGAYTTDTQQARMLGFNARVSF
jgi:hypothetical protein